MPKVISVQTYPDNLKKPTGCIGITYILHTYIDVDFVSQGYIPTNRQQHSLDIAPGNNNK
jgi:hypothetical protein